MKCSFILDHVTTCIPSKIIQTKTVAYHSITSWYQGSWGQHRAQMGPKGPRWAQCGPCEPCYLGYCCQVVPYGNINLVNIGQVMACCLLAPNHYLNQCWLLISKLLWHSPESNFIVSAQVAILYNDFENYKLNIIATSPNGQWLNLNLMHVASITTQIIEGRQ